MKEKYLSVFIPVFNEEDNIRKLYSELNPVLKDLAVEYEIIFIDDNSCDVSYKIMKEIAGDDKNVKALHFKRNYGQTAAMQAGFEYIKQWFRETKGQDFSISPDLPEEVKTAVEATLLSTQDSWWRFPSREETYAHLLSILSQSTPSTSNFVFPR